MRQQLRNNLSIAIGGCAIGERAFVPVELCQVWTECLWDMLEDERAFIKSDVEWNRHGAISTLLRRLIAIGIQEITRDIQFSVWLSTAKMDDTPPIGQDRPILTCLRTFRIRARIPDAIKRQKREN